ncbi:hypothetical protein [Streptomyces albireticuli]|uniref:Uncharacterized protein n=1 Tax=Streptomyces albireticuli TaxID=1940 RepID=A0A2A2DBG7_9ACTN|nr:hypothetical protein [Streptomyces albireticuli]MCD9145458.1 hypothetical protein [Streptomyces albireticuli]MCD9164977.1 hypothetical protein [Streptomyces albireticuli]MCD9195432.1 hypothetical protein [Streptomyces albireticuli]PAU48719.1 hypothetical protein CK936_11750 [Streptomyces albireticuli]
MGPRREHPLSEDALGGLARPYIPYLSLTPEDTLAWAQTTSTSWTTLYRGHAFAQHPGIYAYIPVFSGSTQVRLLVNGTQVGPKSKPGTVLELREALPDFKFSEIVEIQVQGRATAEGRVASCSVRMLYGMRTPTK